MIFIFTSFIKNLSYQNPQIFYRRTNNRSKAYLERYWFIKSVEKCPPP